MSILSRAKKALQKAEKTPSSKAVPKKETIEKKTVTAESVESAMEMAQLIKLKPLMTEKAFKQQDKNTVVFSVRPSATKGQIQTAIVEQFGVMPISIRTAQFMSKTRRRGSTVGATNNWKKAYIEVSDIHKILGSEEA